MKANTDTLQKQEEEKSFRFNEWIEAAPGQKERLLSTGMNPRSRHYTPAQVRLIVEVLQEP